MCEDGISRAVPLWTEGGQAVHRDIRARLTQTSGK